MKLTRTAVPLLLLIATACSGDSSTGPENRYEDISGTYNGSLVGLSQGVAMNSTFTLTMNQSGGSISGSWGLVGVLSDGVNSLQIAGIGPLTGSVAAGTNPSVNVTVKSAACPSYSAAFSGAYDSTNRKITISGPVDIFAANSCDVALRYNSTIILSR